MPRLTEDPFVILPEEEVPLCAQDCARCELARQRARMIWGEGNPHARILLLLDNPGAREDREGQAFLCGTRETLQRGLREAGLALEAVYVTYLLKCRPIRAYDKPAARAACAPHLQLQIGEKGPQLLFGFGNVVAESLFPEREDATVKALRGRWLEAQGIPTGLTYHPLAVRRRPNLMSPFVEDLTMLADRWRELDS
ncbi:uracil-DNA glycosylase [Paenibacillus sp. J31TS4]|uniref:uracil-DNA glycosylase n=1 Tax=Paenibacillus sp. J31TS4 TaxID=2807195 RepID=UPI001AFE70D8|nr:uracil-DNA glycosylase [Paenibacillus sp. J31TS4]GIP40544.1 uracil-DNA glycosylase [Paenibacillus sp. J31TS4]